MYNFNIFSPKTLEEALKLKKEYGEELHPLAGGTDVFVSVRNNRVDWGDKPSLLNLNKIKDLHFIKETETSIEIGPLITHNDLIEDKLAQIYLPALVKAISFIGSPQIRNSGTIVGNVVHASPAADSLPILYTREAKIQIQNFENRHIIPIHSFITGPGEVSIDPQGIVTKIMVPKLSGYIGDYLSLRQRQALSCNVVSLGIELMIKDKIIDDIRIALGAVSPTVVRGKKTENYLRKKKIIESVIQHAHDLIQTECAPINDIRSNKNYRQAMTGVLLSRFLMYFVKK